MLVAKKTADSFTRELVPQGNHHGILKGVFDIGKQKKVYMGDNKLVHQVVFVFEISERMTQGEFKGERFNISKKYTFSLNDKSNLKKDLESWRSKPFTDDELNNGIDLEKLVGINCLLNITHKESDSRVYTNITAITPLMKGMTALALEKPYKPGEMPGWVVELSLKAVKTEMDEQRQNLDDGVMQDPWGSNDENISEGIQSDVKTGVIDFTKVKKPGSGTQPKESDDDIPF
jgi:hypothetical protein